MLDDQKEGGAASTPKDHRYSHTDIAREGQSKAENSPPGTDVHDAPSLADSARDHEYDDTDAADAVRDYLPDEPAPAGSNGEPSAAPASESEQKDTRTNGRGPWPYTSEDKLDPLLDDAKRLMALFRADGRRNIYDGCEKHESNPLKWKTNNKFSDGPATLAHWQSHLRGEQGLALVPILEGDLCWWGCIDDDEYDANPLDIIARAEREKTPLVPARSKSGGLRLWLFVDHDAMAKDVQAALRLYVRRLGLGSKTEVFPKQTALLPGGTGSAVNVPYFGSDLGGKLRMQVGLKKTGAEMTLGEFIRRAESTKLTPEHLSAVLAKRTPEERVEDEARQDSSKELLARDPEMCAYACDVLKNDDLSWDEWAQRGLAMWAAFEDKGRARELFERLSQKSGKSDGAKTKEKWEEIL